jgi:hypothetical protein
VVHGSQSALHKHSHLLKATKVKLKTRELTNFVTTQEN